MSYSRSTSYNALSLTDRNVKNNEQFMVHKMGVITKTSFFRKLQMAFAMANTKSMKNKLAQNIYSSPQRNPESIAHRKFSSRNGSTSSLPKVTQLQKLMFTNFEDKTLKMPEYNCVIKELKEERKRLNDQVSDIRNKLRLQNNLLQKTDTNNNLLDQEMKATREQLKQNKSMRDRVNITTDTTNNQIKTMQKHLSAITEQNEDKLINIKECEQENKQLEEFTKNCKLSLMKTQKELNILKNNLSTGLKNMSHLAIMLKQLQEEKAEILLVINHAVKTNPLK